MSKAKIAICSLLIANYFATERSKKYGTESITSFIARIY